MKARKLNVTIQPWHIWGVAILGLAWLATYIQSTAWTVTMTWLAVIVVATTGLGVILLAGFVYRLLVRLIAQAAADNMTLDVKEKQHKLLMGLTDDEFRKETTGLSRR